MRRGISVNRSPTFLYFGCLLLASAACGDAEAQTSNQVKEMLAEMSRLQELVTTYRQEVEGYRKEVQTSSQLQIRIANVEAKLPTLTDAASQWLAYGVVGDEVITPLVRPEVSKGIPSIKGINIVKERPGLWTLTFVPPLLAKPVVLVSVEDASNSRVGSASVSDLDERGFKVKTSSDGVVLGDLAFSFFVLSGERH